MKRAVYDFAAAHADSVAAGTKTRTIRRVGKRRHAAPGDVVVCYAGRRTKSCRLLRKAVCTSARPVLLVIGADGGLERIEVDGERLHPDAWGAFAEADGFPCVEAMADFFFAYHGPGRHDMVMIEWGAPT